MLTFLCLPFLFYFGQNYDFHGDFWSRGIWSVTIIFRYISYVVTRNSEVWVFWAFCACATRWNFRMFAANFTKCFQLLSLFARARVLFDFRFSPNCMESESLRYFCASLITLALAIHYFEYFETSAYTVNDEILAFRLFLTKCFRIFGTLFCSMR